MGIGRLPAGLWWSLLTCPASFALVAPAARVRLHQAPTTTVPVVRDEPGLAIHLIIEPAAAEELPTGDAVDSLSLRLTNPSTRDDAFKGFLKKYQVSESEAIHAPEQAKGSYAFQNLATTTAAPESSAGPVALHSLGGDSAYPGAPAPAPALQIAAIPAPAPAPVAAPSLMPGSMIDGVPLGMQPQASTTTTPMVIESTTLQMSAHEKAYGMKLRDMHKLAGATPAWDPEAPEPIAFPVERPKLVRAGVRCQAQEMQLAQQKTAQLCADRAAQYGAKYFAYGSGSVAGECTIEYTNTDVCEEGFVAAAFNFFKLEPFMVRVLPSRFGVECPTMTVSLGTFETPEECGKWATIAGGEYFGFGLRQVAGECRTGPVATPEHLEEAGTLAAHASCQTKLRAGDFDIFKLELMPGAPPGVEEPFPFPKVGKLAHVCLGSGC
eukprot:TRINITY_DN444_c1_g1_i1.p1 TRINITY_DN444_c1_g1~~TRINITY_DN444_c1_g1_i1.p1  ORF type:complete len:437 (+),score=68.87 TRINITY_DN444_c1_g1_i1:157-1467(+)